MEQADRVRERVSIPWQRWRRLLTGSCIPGEAGGGSVSESLTPSYPSLPGTSPLALCSADVGKSRKKWASRSCSLGIHECASVGTYVAKNVCKISNDRVAWGLNPKDTHGLCELIQVLHLCVSQFPHL